jgi:hypothetical protein
VVEADRFPAAPEVSLRLERQLLAPLDLAVT